MLNDLLDLNEIQRLNPLEFAIDELLPKGGIFVLGGDPKWGKSVIELDLILRGVKGEAAFGKFKQRYSKALIVNVEGRHQGIKMREHMFAQQTEETKSKVVISGEPFYLTLSTGQPNLYVFQRLKEKIQEHGFELVALDPLISFHSGDENNSQQMVAMLDHLRSVGEATKCAFVILHHTRKMGSQQTLEMAIEQGGAMLRGASGIFGAVDSLALLWKIASGKRRLLTFSCRYARGDTNPVEMQMDHNSWRMYYCGEEHEPPDPNQWAKDQLGDMDWTKYQEAFKLSPDMMTKARAKWQKET